MHDLVHVAYQPEPDLKSLFVRKKQNTVFQLPHMEKPWKTEEFISRSDFAEEDQKISWPWRPLSSAGAVPWMQILGRDESDIEILNMNLFNFRHQALCIAMARSSVVYHTLFPMGMDRGIQLVPSINSDDGDIFKKVYIRRVKPSSLLSFFIPHQSFSSISSQPIRAQLHSSLSLRYRNLVSCPLSK